jgi:hypothetical protein
MRFIRAAAWHEIGVKGIMLSLQEILLSSRFTVNGTTRTHFRIAPQNLYCPCYNVPKTALTLIDASSDLQGLTVPFVSSKLLLNIDYSEKAGVGGFDPVPGHHNSKT